MQVKHFLEIKARQVITVLPEAPIHNAMAFLIKNSISCLPVVDASQELVGIISDKDIFKAAYNNPNSFTESTVQDLMTTNLIVGVPDDDLDYIGALMTNNRIRHIPIVDQARIVGLVSVGDIVKSQLKTFEIENRYLKQYIQDSYPA